MSYDTYDDLLDEIDFLEDYIEKLEANNRMLRSKVEDLYERLAESSDWWF
jgi:chaperonin cofactor prefoldin